MNKLILSGTILILHLSVAAQSAKEKLQKVFEPFNSHVNINIQGEITLHENGNTTPLETMGMSMQRSATCTYAQLGDIEMLEEAGNVLVIDHGEKMLSLAKEQPAQPLEQYMDPKELIKLIGVQEMEYTEVQTGDDLGGIRIAQKGIYDQFLLVKYDKKTWELKQIQSTMPDPDPEEQTDTPVLLTLIAYYHKVDFSPGKRPVTLQNYFNLKNGQYIPLPKYRAYEFLSSQ